VVPKTTYDKIKEQIRQVANAHEDRRLIQGGRLYRRAWTRSPVWSACSSTLRSDEDADDCE
jgi:hypothetical protein